MTSRFRSAHPGLEDRYAHAHGDEPEIEAEAARRRRERWEAEEDAGGERYMNREEKLEAKEKI